MYKCRLSYKCLIAVLKGQMSKLSKCHTREVVDLFIRIKKVSIKIYDKRDDFDFEIVNFSFLDGDAPRSTSYGVFISLIIRFARASSHFADFNTCNKLLTQKLLKQDIGIINLAKLFLNFIDDTMI